MIDDHDLIELRHMIHEEVRLQLADALHTLANTLADSVAPPSIVGTLDPRLIAVLTAAAAAAIGAPVLVKKVAVTQQGLINPSAWGNVGRMSVQTSHNVRPSRHR